MNFYSQQGEDLFLFSNFINQKRKDGRYLELGAFDGVTYSNTKFFEDELGFTGVLIEPLAEAYKNLCYSRPNNECHNVAIDTQHKTVEFVGMGATAGISDLMSSSFKKHHHQHNESYTVSASTLSSILRDASYSYLDLLSIDVEGGEQTVLESMDWSIPVYIVCIELDGSNESKDEACRNILKVNGFEFKHRMCINEFWVNPLYERASLLYNSTDATVQVRGNYPFMEPHCIPDIKKGLISYAQKQG